jgi:hypothetical protein
MTEREFQAYCKRLDEQPTYRWGGAITFMGEVAEYRAPRLLPRTGRAVDLTARRLHLDELEVRMREVDRMLEELS